MSLRDDCARATANVRQAHIDHLLRLRIPGEAIAHLGQYQMPFGIEQIETDDAGRWWTSPDGATALLLPVIERDETVDLVAFHSSPTAPLWWQIGSDHVSTPFTNANFVTRIL